MASSLRNQHQAENTEQLNEFSLHSVFQCFENDLCERFNTATAEFLAPELRFSLAEITYTPGLSWRENDYFVTQVALGREVALVIKVSDAAANLIFLNTLGNRHDEPGFLKLKDITEVEARILTAYNEFLYRQISELFLDTKEINSVIHTRQAPKTVYLTFYIYTNDEQEAGRIILSFPRFVYRKIKHIPRPQQMLKLDFFNNCAIETDILVGKTSASLDEIKTLEPEDLIILDDSSIHAMYLRGLENINININPSSRLVIDFEDNENGESTVIEEKTGNKSIWDSLEVEVNAGFEKVRMKLGELREITEGLVIDVASVANNKVYIDVEGQKVAAGELVIIGDKYGVRVTEIFSEAKSAEVEKLEEQAPEQSIEQDQYIESDEDEDEMEIDEDFDESDFEIDDEEDE